MAQAADDEKKAGELPEIKSVHSLTKKYLTKEVWAKYKDHKTKTCGMTISDCAMVSFKLDNQHVGCYAGDEDCYIDFKDFFDPVIADYHNIRAKRDEKKKAGKPLHESNLNFKDLKGNIGEDLPIASTRIRVGRNIKGYGLSPGITQKQRLEVEALMKDIFSKLKGDLKGTYYPLLGMKEDDRKQLVADHFLFKNDDPNLQISNMARDWPEGRGIFHNDDKTFLVWVNEEDQLRIISMQKGCDVVACFERLARGINEIEALLKTAGKAFQFSNDYGFFHSCPTNLGTGMRASVHMPLPGWNKKGKEELQKRCNELGVQARGIHGEATKDDSGVFDISNKYRLGYSEVELVQMMIEGVNTIWKEECELAAKK